MNSVDKFLELVNLLPRKIVRSLKLLKVVEDNSKDLKNQLKKSREKHLEKLKENNFKNSESTSLKSIEKLNKEIQILSDYKLELIKEIHFLLQSSFINKLTPIIEEGRKEIDNNINGQFNSLANSEILGNSLSDINKRKDDMDSISTKGGNNLLGLKKNRNKSNKRKKNNLSEYSEDIQNSQNEEKQKKYCICNAISYGKMIECDNPNCKLQWFHLSCVGIKEGEEPDTWYCSKECENESKMSKKKINKRKKNFISNKRID